MKTKYTKRCIDIVYLMQNGWILLVGISETSGRPYFQVTKGFERDYFNSRVFDRLLRDGLIYQESSPPFDWTLTEDGKTMKFNPLPPHNR